MSSTPLLGSETLLVVGICNGIDWRSLMVEVKAATLEAARAELERQREEEKVLSNVSQDVQAKIEGRVDNQ